MKHEDLLSLAYACIDELNRQLPSDRRLTKSPQTALLGDGSTLDSLSLINFIVAFEEAIEQTHGVQCSLLEDDVLGDPAGPLGTVGSLVDFIGRTGA